ncbi:hypothetical protein V5N11_030898 [Cardamine amara subsp. amara]|uniref:Uncharacterized protein n=1 Tax=Cardamine amara subsp. amara TaxID=228776 RepID=A0ABD1BHA8_CARAN
MPMDIATRLGICDIKDSMVDITLADASVKTSTGFVEDLQVKVGDCLLPCDFHVVEMANDAHMPLILGRLMSPYFTRFKHIFESILA